MTTNPLRARIDQATATELKKLSEALKLKPIRGGASRQSRLEVAFFDTLDRARPKSATGALSYGASLAAASVLMTPPTKAEFVADVKWLGQSFAQLFASSADAAVLPNTESEDALAQAERALLDRVAGLATAGKKPGEDPVRVGLKIGGIAAVGALSALLAITLAKGSWDSDAVDRLIRATVLVAGIGERLRLEAKAMADS